MPEDSQTPSASSKASTVTGSASVPSTGAQATGNLAQSTTSAKLSAGGQRLLKEAQAFERRSGGDVTAVEDYKLLAQMRRLSDLAVSRGHPAGRSEQAACDRLGTQLQSETFPSDLRQYVETLYHRMREESGDPFDFINDAGVYDETQR